MSRMNININMNIGSYETELELEADYTVTATYPETEETPGEDAGIEINAIRVYGKDGKQYGIGVLCEMMNFDEDAVWKLVEEEVSENV